MQSLPGQTARAHQEPFAVQFSVFLANRVGQLHELLEKFDERQVAVVGVSVVDSADWAVIRIVFSDPNKAREILRTANLPFTESNVMLVALASNDSLSEACGHLLGAEVNIHFAYPLTIRTDDNPVMVFHVDDLITATHVLIRHGFKLLGYEDLADPK
ncbi:MAG: acetolactate synthase [Planctomycetota bacterium]|jgi:hypothetical protein